MDVIFDGFLERQLEIANEINESSDLVSLCPLAQDPSGYFTPFAGPKAERMPLPRHYMANFRCKGLVRDNSGIKECSDWTFGIWFPDDYLRIADPYKVVALISPVNAYHPNISAPFICLGHLDPGTDLWSLCYQIYDIVTFNNVTMVESDALNPESCPWARSEKIAGRFPVDSRPLKRRLLNLKITSVGEEI